MRLLTWFHTHPVADATFLGADTRTCATVDEGGRLRVWPVSHSTDPKGFRMLSFTSALTSVVSDLEGKVLLVGSDSGCVHAVKCATWKQLEVADTLRVSEAGIAKLACVAQEDGACLYVAAALFNHKIALLCVTTENPVIRMFGYVDLQGSIEDICFHGMEHDDQDSSALPRVLVVGTASEGPWPCLWSVRPPPLDYEPAGPAGPELRRDVCPVWSSKLAEAESEGREAREAWEPEHQPTAVAATLGPQVVVGFAGGALKMYPLPSQLGLLSAIHPVVVASGTLSPHGQLVTSLRLSIDGKCLLSTSMDGSVRRSSLEQGANDGVLQKFLHSPYNGGVLQACGSSDNVLMLSTGGTDGVLVWAAPGVPVDMAGTEDEEEDGEDAAFDLAIELDDKDLTAFPVWAASKQEDGGVAQAESDETEASVAATVQRKALGLEVESLRKRLRVLVEQNTHCSELEQLERHEFCIDFEERDAIAAKTKERCDELRSQIEQENVARQLIRDRIIKEFWEPIRTKGCQITSLMSKLAVSNYPERAASEEEQSTIRKLRILRRVELLDQAAGQGDTLLKPKLFAQGQEDYVVNWWQPEAGAKNDKSLLYAPFELLTNCRRRLQIHLLQSLAADHRADFNGLFKNCQHDKKTAMDQIREKVARIRAILGELQIREQVPEPEFQDLEDPESVLRVKDREIKAQKWISPEERQRQAEAAAREEERLRQLRENDAGQRALMQMMGGTLKTKKDLSALEITLEREPWMDQIPLDEMTDVQRQALKEFEEKEKALAEEQDKYRKQLDAELKKLRADVQELMQQFEVVLKELHHQRFLHDAKFFCQELYCVRLQLALLQSVEDDQVLKQSLRDVEEARSKLSSAEKKLEGFQKQVAAMRERQEERVRHEKEVSSAQHFRQQFAQSGLEPEAVTALLQIFRRRRDAVRRNSAFGASGLPGLPGLEADPRRTTGAGALFQASGALGALGALGDPSPLPPVDFEGLTTADPYPDLGAAAETTHLASQEEDVGDACPEGVDEANFARMLELRADRFQAEMEVQKGTVVLQEMGGLLAHLEKERDDAKLEHDQLQSELTEHCNVMERELFDIEILFQLKQGQVEVPQAAVVTDYSDAIVIDQDVVESRNHRILELGKDKVGTLETIKSFRKKLNLIQWEHKMLALQTSDLEERTKDVHMLRVTKGLQSLLKGREEGRNKADADLLERKIEHLNTTSEQKEQSLKKQYAMASHATKLRKMENGMLEKKLRELQQNVIQREHIRRLRAPQVGAGGAREGERPRIVGGGGRIQENEATVRAAQATFREVQTRQHLMEAARRHTEEIEVLRKELDRLRQKTFPSFVQLHEDRPKNPDHIG